MSKDEIAKRIAPYNEKVQQCDHKYECTYEGMDGESYRCEKCGHRYFLDYDEMR